MYTFYIGLTIDRLLRARRVLDTTHIQSLGRTAHRYRDPEAMGLARNVYGCYAIIALE